MANDEKISAKTMPASTARVEQPVRSIEGLVNLHADSRGAEDAGLSTGQEAAGLISVENPPELAAASIEALRKNWLPLIELLALGAKLGAIGIANKIQEAAAWDEEQKKKEALALLPDNELAKKVQEDGADTCAEIFGDIRVPAVARLLAGCALIGKGFNDGCEKLKRKVANGSKPNGQNSNSGRDEGKREDNQAHQ